MLNCYFAVVCAVHPAPSPFLSSIKPDIIEDDNATIPIVGGIGGEEGRNSGVTSGHQDETVVQHRITVTMEELSVREHFFGEDMSVTVIASAAHESTSTSQQEARDGVNTHGERLQPACPLPAVAHVVLHCFLPQVVTPRCGRGYRDDTL